MAETCPIPHVGQSLEPYIHPRSTISSIRQSLHSHLERQLRLEATQTLSLVNISDPPLTQTLPDPPASVTGVRRAYWRALRAHQVARERYEGLRAELDVAGRSAGEGLTSASTADGGDGRNGELLLLLKARERRRKLGAVEKAMEAVEREGKGVVGAKVDDVVKRSVGDVPVLPTQRGVASGGSGREEGEMRMVELKKAILGAKATAEKCREQMPPSDVKSSDNNELLALQQSRNELIGWIEKQLALIGDAQAEDNNNDASSPTAKNTSRPEATTPILTNAEITQLYDHYLSARSTLLTTLQEPPDISPLAPTPDDSPHQTPTLGPIETSETATRTSTATLLLPYIAPLLTTASSEASTHQQSAYMRRQLSTADAASERLLRRLADESHLVHPGASRGRDWGRAGEEAGEATREYVLARAKAGEISSKEAEGLLGRLAGIGEGMERLVR